MYAGQRRRVADPERGADRPAGRRQESTVAARCASAGSNPAPKTTHQGRHRCSENSALCTTAGIVWPVAPCNLVSFGDGFVTVCSYGRADCGRDLQLGRPHRLLPAGAGARTPPARQAHLLRRSTSRSSRSTPPSTGFRAPPWSRAGSSGPPSIPLQHQGVSEPHRPRARGPDRPRKPTADEERDFMAALAPLRDERQARRRPLPVPAVVDQPSRGARMAARGPGPPPRRPARDRVPAPLLVRRRRLAGDRGPAPGARVRLRRRRLRRRSAPPPRRRCSPSPHRGCASRGSTVATARPGTRAGPPAAIASTTCTRRPSSRNGFRRYAPRAMTASRSTSC